MGSYAPGPGGITTVGSFLTSPKPAPNPVAELTAAAKAPAEAPYGIPGKFLKRSSVDPKN